MECVPTERVLMANCAEPLADSAAVPNAAEPSDQVTEPVGVPPKVVDTTAPSVTLCPKSDGLRLELAAVVLVATLTICCTDGDVLVTRLASPLYFAVREWVPTDSEETGICAELEDSATVPRTVAPSKNVSVPVAVPPNAD